MNKPRHFLDISELPLEELRSMLALSSAMKAKLKAHEKGNRPLEGKTLAMIFEKPSTRTGCRSTSACASSAVNRSC